MQATHLAKAPVRLLSTALILAAISAAALSHNAQGQGVSCPDCPDLEPLVTVYKSQGTFDIWIDEFPSFDSTGVSEVRIDFERNGVAETYNFGFDPADIEWGIDKTGLSLPGSLDYTVNSGLTATLVFEEPSTQVKILVDVKLVDGE